VAGRVQLTRWRRGANKVALTRLIQQHTDLGLHDAHGAVVRLLNGEAVKVEVRAPATFLLHAACMGAEGTLLDCHIEDSNNDSEETTP